MKVASYSKVIAGIITAGLYSASFSQTLGTSATAVVTTPANNEQRASESFGSVDGEPLAARATISDSSELEFNPIFKGSASASSSATAEYGTLKVFAQSSATGFAGGSANASASFSDSFRIDGGQLNGSRGFITTKVEYEWATGSVTDVTFPNNLFGVSLQLQGYMGFALASDSFQSNFGNPSFESALAVSRPDGTLDYLPRTFTF